MLSLVGGKWTTFRASAEHLADRALALLALPRRRSTKGVPIGGGRGYPMTERARQQWIAAHDGGLPASTRVATLLDRYGTVAADVIDAIAADDDDAAAADLPDYSTGELRHLAARPRTSSTSTTSCCGAPASRSSARRRPMPPQRSRMPIAPVLGWDASAAARRGRARARAGPRRRPGVVRHPRR